MPEITITTIILIRHAERDNSSSADPHLNDKGILRANSLVRIMGSAGIKAIYTSHFIRTKETVSLLAAHLGILPVTLDDPADIMDHILENHTGEKILVVGHTNTIPELIGLLGNTDISIAENEFDNLFLLTRINAATSSLLRLKYGS